MKALDKLLSIASDPISAATPDLGWAFDLGVSRSALAELVHVLNRKNGFFAFESALLVMPSVFDGRVRGLKDWNLSDGWIVSYDRVPKPAVFFAQDAFAGQYGITESAIIGLNPETGELTSYGTSLNEWAQILLADYDSEAGWSAARDWQLQHGPLRPGDRLLPKKPFVLGGGYLADNLVAVENSEAMRKWGTLYHQVRDIPDGSTITVKDWIWP